MQTSSMPQSGKDERLLMQAASHDHTTTSLHKGTDTSRLEASGKELTDRPASRNYAHKPTQQSIGPQISHGPAASTAATSLLEGYPIPPFWSRGKWRTLSVRDAYDEDTVFDWEPTDVVPDYVYDRMKPALQLACAMLKYSDPFMTRIFCAPILDDGTRRGVLDAEYSTSAADHREYRSFLQKLRHSYCLYIGDCVMRSGKPGHAFSSYHLTTTGKEQFVCQIDLSYMDFYYRPNYEAFSEQHKRKLHLFLATTLVHELCHTIARARRISPNHRRQADIDAGVDFTEFNFDEFRYHPRQTEAELGFTWEAYFFGETHHPIDPEADGDELEHAGYSKPFLVKAYIAHEKRHRYLDDDVIEGLFDIQKWDEYSSAGYRRMSAQAGATIALVDDVRTMIRTQDIKSGKGRFRECMRRMRERAGNKFVNSRLNVDTAQCRKLILGNAAKRPDNIDILYEGDIDTDSDSELNSEDEMEVD